MNTTILLWRNSEFDNMVKLCKCLCIFDKLSCVEATWRFEDSVVWNGNKWGWSGWWGEWRSSHCLPLIGRSWRHYPPMLPPPSLLRSPLLSPPLPAQLSSCYPHHNRSIGYNISNLNQREKISAFGSFYPTLFTFSFHGFMLGASSFPRFLGFLPPSPLLPSLPLLSLLNIYFYHAFLPSTICNEAAPVSC